MAFGGDKNSSRRFSNLRESIALLPYFPFLCRLTYSVYKESFIHEQTSPYRFSTKLISLPRTSIFLPRVYSGSSHKFSGFYLGILSFFVLFAAVTFVVFSDLGLAF